MRALALLLVVALTAPALAGCTGLLPGLRELPGPPGSLAADYLRPGYGRVEIVIRTEAGASPNAEALRDARPVLEDAIGKPVAFRLLEGGVRGKGPDGVYTVAEIVELERSVREQYTGGDTAVIHALYLAGRYENGNVLGIAYRGSSVAFFKGSMRDASAEDGCGMLVLNPCGKPEARFLERSVVVHEVGHLLGLVNHGIPMVRPHEQTEDPNPDTPHNEGKGHSRNRESVMYWAVEHAPGAQAFLERGEKIPYRFDADDLADLRAFARG